jgi:transposase-like protein
VIRRCTRNHKICPNDESALKLVYIAIGEASKKWTKPIPEGNRPSTTLPSCTRNACLS